MFRWTRVKLTALYLGVVAVILIIFSVVLYYSFIQNIQNNFEGDYPNNQAQVQMITKTADQLQIDIILIDLLVLLFSGGLSYLFAGKTIRPIQRAMEKQKQFTAYASHELRTPLAVMRTNLEVALREKGGDQQKTRALILGAIDEVKSMTKLTEDLLLISKLESSKKNYEFKKININEIIDLTVKRMQSIAGEKRIRLSASDSAPSFINGNAETLQRLMGSVVSNALDFTPSGGSVDINTSRHNKKVIVHVQDTGTGIAKDDLPHVLERFYRADKARERGGAGLGLFIAAEIAREHQGAINIKSEAGKGTTVIVTFPSVS